jgi:hypothetical protein
MIAEPGHDGASALAARFISAARSERAIDGDKPVSR